MLYRKFDPAKLDWYKVRTLHLFMETVLLSTNRQTLPHTETLHIVYKYTIHRAAYNVPPRHRPAVHSSNRTRRAMYMD